MEHQDRRQVHQGEVPGGLHLLIGGGTLEAMYWLSVEVVDQGVGQGVHRLGLDVQGQDEKRLMRGRWFTARALDEARSGLALEHVCHWCSGAYSYSSGGTAFILGPNLVDENQELVGGVRVDHGVVVVLPPSIQVHHRLQRRCYFQLHPRLRCRRSSLPVSTTR